MTVILQSIWWKSSLSEGNLSRPAQTGRLFLISARNCATLIVDCDTGLKSTDKEEICELPDGNIVTVGAKVFRCAKVLFQPSFTGKEASGIHLLSSWNVTLTSVWVCMPCRVVRWCKAICPGTWRRRLYPGWRSRCLLHHSESTRYGLEDLPCLPSARSSLFRLSCCFVCEVHSRRQRVCCSALASRHCVSALLLDILCCLYALATRKTTSTWALSPPSATCSRTRSLQPLPMLICAGIRGLDVAPASSSCFCARTRGGSMSMGATCSTTQSSGSLQVIVRALLCLRPCHQPPSSQQCYAQRGAVASGEPQARTNANASASVLPSSLLRVPFPRSPRPVPPRQTHRPYSSQVEPLRREISLLTIPVEGSVCCTDQLERSLWSGGSMTTCRVRVLQSLRISNIKFLHVWSWVASAWRRTCSMFVWERFVIRLHLLDEVQRELTT